MEQFQNNKAIETLNKIKEAILENDFASGYQLVLEFENLNPISEKMFASFGQLLFFFKDYQKAQEYCEKNPNRYGLARFYLHFGEYEKAIIEFSNWANNINEPSTLNRFIIRILFAQHKFQILITFIENEMMEYESSLNSYSVKSIESIENEEIVQKRIKRYKQECFINGMTNDELNAIVVSLIVVEKCSSIDEFEILLSKNYSGVNILLSKKIGVKNAFIRNINKNNHAAIDKLIFSLTRIKSKNIQNAINDLISFEKYHGDLTNIQYENDPIMQRVKELFVRYNETNKGFEDFKKIADHLLNSTTNYAATHNTNGLLDYYLLSENYLAALELIRTTNNKYADFTLLINLLLITNNDLIVSDLVEREYLFFGNSLSKFLLSVKNDFTVFVDKKLEEIKNNLKVKFIDTLKECFINISPHYPQSPNLCTDIMYSYRQIYETSPLFETIKNKKIIWAILNYDDNGFMCCNKYFKNIENEFRTSLGIPFKEFGSDAEATVYFFVKKYLPDYTIILQYSPDWLKPQRIDLFIVDLNLAIEYQGRQHFVPISFFGGEIGFENQKKRDSIKRLLCEANRISLEYIDYTDIIEKKVEEILIKYYPILK